MVFLVVMYSVGNNLSYRLNGISLSKQIFKNSSLTKLYSGLSNGCISFFDSFAEHIVQYVVDLQELIGFEGRLWSLYHLLTIAECILTIVFPQQESTSSLHGGMVSFLMRRFHFKDIYFERKTKGI